MIAIPFAAQHSNARPIYEWIRGRGGRARRSARPSLFFHRGSDELGFVQFGEAASSNYSSIGIPGISSYIP